MKDYLIALDLDGTLLYDWSTIHEKTVAYLKSLKAMGHKLVIATGRPYRSSIGFYDSLELNTPLINYNGALVTWKNNPAFTPVNITLNKDDVIDIFTKNAPYIYNAFCEIRDDIYLLEDREDIAPLLHNFNGAKLHVGPLHETLPAGTNGCIIIAHKSQGQHIENYINTHYKNTIGCRNWGDDNRFIIELFSPKTNKGEALKNVARSLGIPRERIIAFGDGMNDVEMLAYAATGVAVNNAHESLRAVADVISPHDHKDHPIERYLSKHLDDAPDFDPSS